MDFLSESREFRKCRESDKDFASNAKRAVNKNQKYPSSPPKKAKKTKKQKQDKNKNKKQIQQTTKDHELTRLKGHLRQHLLRTVPTN